eukprot:354736-Chlamydomonas_euryale.AAC.8
MDGAHGRMCQSSSPTFCNLHAHWIACIYRIGRVRSNWHTATCYCMLRLHLFTHYPNGLVARQHENTYAVTQIKFKVRGVSNSMKHERGWQQRRATCCAIGLYAAWVGAAS